MKNIFIHGLGQRADSWGRTVEGLAGAGDSVCLDLTQLNGEGRADYGTLYGAFAGVCDRCEGPVSLCGLSLGGVLALNYAVERPEKVGALVLIGTQYKMPKVLLTIQNFLFGFMPRRAFSGTGFSKEDTISLCKTMSALDFSGALCKISCPTLVVCGGRDAANRKAAEEMAREIKGSRLAIVSGAGHEINVEAPERLADILQNFLPAG